MTDTRESECSVCPDYVVRCAHFGKLVAFLTDMSLGPVGICTGCKIESGNTGYWVAGPNRFIGEHCNVCKRHESLAQPPTVGIHFSSHPKAEADFIRREALMLSEA